MDWLWPVMLAPFIGSFLGVLVRRLPAGRPVVLARSACEACGVTLEPRDLVPLLSFAALRGQCRACGARIAPFHWWIELAAVAVPLTAALPGPAPERLWLDCGLGWTLLALAWIDWDHMRLPDALTLPLILAGLFGTWWLEPDRATEHALAAALGWLAFRLVAMGYRRLRGRDGLGEGDAKLLAALGAWTGLDGLPGVVLGAALVGLAAVLVLRLRGWSIGAGTAIPFGPCLALAGWAVRLHT